MTLGGPRDTNRPADDVRHRSLFVEHPDAVYELDLDGRFLSANAALEALTGYTVDELREMSFVPLVHPDDAERVGAEFGRAVAGEARTYEATGLHRDGTVLHVQVTNIPIVVAGEVVGVFGIARDVSARHRAEAALERSRSLLRIAGRMARVGGWAVDLATEEVFWSDEMYEILEYPPDRTPDLEAALDMYPAPHRDRVTQALEACRTEGAPFDLELAARTAGGRELWVREVGEAERDASGTIVRVQGAFQDISDRKAAEDQARWLTEQLTATLESMTDAFYTVDPGWCITYVNTSFERLVQQDRAEMVGRVLWDVFPEAVGSPFEAAHRRAADEGAPTVVEAFYEPLDGWFEGRIYPTGQGLAVYVRDVSRRVEREQALQRVATAEQEAAERLRGLDRTKNAFLSAVSHELRTPLTIVQGMSETLRHRRDDLDDASRTRLEDALVANARRLGRLLEDLLDIDRLVRGRGSPEPGPVDAAALLRAGVAVSPVGARAVVDAPDQLDATADRVQVERILANLLDNAAKYAPDGVVHVRLRPLRAGGFRLEVEDQGPGIPAGELTAAFEPFHRLDDEHPQPGTGIGLALVREFAAGHGGRAWAEPADSVGLRVVVEIPNPSDG